MVALAPGLSFCAVDDDLVFLDVLKDRYFALRGEKARHFIEIVNQQARGQQVSAEAIDEFVADRILVPSDDQAIRATEVRPARNEWKAHERIAARPSPSLVLQGVAAIAVTWLSLRMRSLEANLSLKRTVNPRKLASTTDLDAFSIARRIFPFQIDCLPNSLALRRLLASRGFRPTLVLGVRMAPFAAHCWLQFEDMVVGDSIERVRAFSPICVMP